ncbi:MAG: CBS domain-containing protein, partial [Candidatus Eisenbacteria bacterium]|nr:CBS domain-containing protein [Candidatus Eisenbacteria bacterium]
STDGVRCDQGPQAVCRRSRGGEQELAWNFPAARLLQEVVMPADGLTGTIIGYLAWVNLAVGLFNLVPGFPLDGGRLLRALVWKRTGSFQRGTRAASDLGKGVAIVLMVLGGLQVFSGMILGGIWFILIGIFLRSIAKQGYEQLILRQALEGVRVSEVMTEDIVTVPSAMTLEELTEQHFLREGRSSYPVVDGGHVRGVVAISDLSKTDRSRFSDVTVEQVMTPLAQLHTLSPETPLVEALAEMGPGNPRRQLVLENDHLLGMLGIEDLTRVMKVREALARP